MGLRDAVLRLVTRCFLLVLGDEVGGGVDEGGVG